MEASARVDGETSALWRTLPSAVLTVVPVAILAAWLSLLAVKGPYWLGNNSDPDYAYLINGLGLCYGYVPGHVDHPGTPLQILVAVGLAITHSLTGSGQLADDVLQRPEKFLVAVNGVLLVLFAGALTLAGRAALRATGSLLAGLTAEIVPGLAPVVAVHVICVKPEPLLATLAALVAARTLRTLAPDRMPSRASDAAALGALVGMAIATKVSAAPLAVLPLLVLKGRAARIRFAGVAAATFAVATLPAWSGMAAFHSFIARIATHSGRYGSGRAALFDAGEYLRGLHQLATEVSGEITLALAAVGFLLAMALTWRIRRGSGGSAVPTRDALLAATTMQAVSFLLVARHSASHYLLPAIVVSGLTAALAIHAVTCLIPPQPALRGVATVAMACLLALGGLRLLRELRERRTWLTAQRDARLAAVGTLAQRFPGARVLHFYRSSSPAFALHFGDLYDEARWSGRIQELHPRDLFYNRWIEQLEAYHPDPARPSAKPLEYRPLTQEDLCGVGGEGPVVVLGPLLPDGPASAASGSVLRSRVRLIFSSGEEAIYLPRGCPAGADGAPP